MNCSISGLCDGYFIDGAIVNDIADCIYFCRNNDVSTKFI